MNFPRACGYASPVSKVTAFVTRDNERGRELLVFRHPTAGVQLPAGTVEEGEAPERAVLREAFEETGLANLTLKAEFGERSEPLAEGGRMIARSTALRRHPAHEAAETGVVLRRGWFVREAAVEGDFARITNDEYELRDGALHKARTVDEGWVSIAAIATSIQRSFYHLTADGATADRWTHFAEGEHDFECYRVPLSENPGLVRGQFEWLASFGERLEP